MIAADSTPAASLALATTCATPDGPFTIVATADAVLASGWTEDVDSLVALIHPSVRPASVTTDPAAASAALRDRIDSAAEAVVAYYAGDHSAPARVPVAQRSGEFRARAWEVLRTVPAGTPLTYTAYAEATGRPTAVRAAASACAHNAAALFVPCHRIIRSDGSLGGFRYGLAIKQSLLDRERGAARPS